MIYNKADRITEATVQGAVPAKTAGSHDSCCHVHGQDDLTGENGEMC